MRNEIFELLEPLVNNVEGLPPEGFQIVNDDFRAGLRLESSCMKFQATSGEAIQVGELIKVTGQDPAGVVTIEKALQGEKPFGVCISTDPLEVCAFSVWPVLVQGSVSIGDELILSTTPGEAVVGVGVKAGVALEANPDPNAKFVKTYLKPYV